MPELKKAFTAIGLDGLSRFSAWRQKGRSKYGVKGAAAGKRDDINDPTEVVGEGHGVGVISIAVELPGYGVASPDADSGREVGVEGAGALAPTDQHGQGPGRELLRLRLA